MPKTWEMTIVRPRSHKTGAVALINELTVTKLVSLLRSLPGDGKTTNLIRRVDGMLCNRFQPGAFTVSAVQHSIQFFAQESLGNDQFVVEDGCQHIMQSSQPLAFWLIRAKRGQPK
jgi:hypothetical protein